MKRNVFAIFAMVLFSACLSAAEEKVPLATGEWEPYVGKQLENYGIASEIVTAASKAANIVPEYRFYPWKRAEMNAEAGAEFATFPFKQTDERNTRFNFSDTIINSNYGMLILKSNKNTQNFNYTKPEDLKGFNIGIVVGTDPIKIPVEKAGGKIEEVQEAVQNLKKLEAGRIDFYMDDKAVIHATLKKNYSKEQINNFILLDSSFGDVTEFKLMVSKKYQNNKEILNKFNEGLKTIKGNGEYKKILMKHGLK